LQQVLQHGVQQVSAHGAAQATCLTTVRGTMRQQSTVSWQGTHLATM
jgi:hypothetical protein